MTEEQLGEQWREMVKGCPVPAGTCVMVLDHLGGIQIWNTYGPTKKPSSWNIKDVTVYRTNYGVHYLYPIIRYRIRKPRGMKVLEELLQNLPEDVDA